MLVMGMDKAAEFYKKSFAGLFAYVANRIPEISNEIYKIDDALKAGFGWELGPFETWDTIGFEQGIKLIEGNNKSVAPWITEMKEAGISSFYKVESGKKFYYDIDSKSYLEIPGGEDLVSLDTLRDSGKIWGNADTTIVDLGDGKTELHLSFSLTIYPEKVPGVPRLLAGKAKPMIEGLVEKMIAPNLTSLGKGINEYYSKQ